MKPRSPLLGLLVLGLIGVTAGPAEAQEIYKYKKADGTVTYTDNLAELPEDRRAFYNQQAAEREAERAKMEAAVGKEELARREAEAERDRLMRESEESAQRAERLAAVDARLKELNQKSVEQDRQKATWQGRMIAARQRLKQLLEAYKKAETAYNEVGTMASYTLLPGQAEQRDQAEATMKRLEPQIDSTIQEIEVKIPAEARRAGIPPGWLRGL